MADSLDRRTFLKSAAAAGAAVGLNTAVNPALLAAEEGSKPLFRISLAEWSFHRTLNDKKTMTNLDFPVVAKRDFGIDSVEYVNQFFMDKARDTAYLTELKKRCDDNGVRSVLIMCDSEGDLGDRDNTRRMKAVENHHKWVDAAKFLGCHSIRVNARSSGSYADQMKLAADGLNHLNDYGKEHEIGIIVENHGGLSSNGEWLAGVMKIVDSKNCGTLPDFGNFKVSDTEEYDRYKGVQELMPYAKGASAKTYAFDDQGNETTIDYPRMMKIVVDAGYHGFVGIEYEGSKHSEMDGVRLTKQLLERIRDKMAS